MKSMLSLWEDDTQQAKHSLRRDMRRMRRALSSGERAHKAHAACVRLLALDALAPGTVVAVYSAVRTEIDPGYAARELERRGCTLVYPRTATPPTSPALAGGATLDQRALSFHRVPRAEERVASPFGVLEPRPEHPRVPLEQIDVIVVPGLAFDRRGARLGWGKGYYDITLARSSALRVGFAYHCQLIEEVPADANDAPMDLVITDACTLEISERARAHGSSTSLSPHDP